MGGKPQRPSKKQRRVHQYNSDSSDDGQDFDAVNLLDSDDDINNAKVDDVGADDDSDASSIEEDTQAKVKPAAAKSKLKAKLPIKKGPVESDNDDNEETAPEHDLEEDEDEDDDDEDDDSDMYENDEFDIEGDDNGSKKPKKRNDPTAFATSLSKILSTKLSTSKRSDPMLSRSAAAHEASKAVQDSALEAKARRQLREQKKKASEKGRVKNVLLATRSEATGEPDTTTAEILASEAKLRKTAQRGVVKMFNAVRAAQVKSTEAERSAREAGMIGMGRREEKANEMSKKGFLDLIASGGGGLKRGGLEEA
jgi:hypothetical protein